MYIKQLSGLTLIKLHLSIQGEGYKNQTAYLVQNLVQKSVKINLMAAQPGDRGPERIQTEQQKYHVLQY